jgi:tetratricopeptide (TPR) repeat protein
MFAEQAYLFRHAVLRDAAYQMQLPAVRVELHRLIIEIVHALFGDSDSALMPYALELADHVDSAIGAGNPGLEARRVRYLQLARRHAFDRGRPHDAQQAVRRLLALPGLSSVDRVDAACWGGEISSRLGDLASAELYHRAALKAASVNDGSVYRSMRGLADIHWRTRRTDEAESLLRDAVSRAKAGGARREEARATGTLGTIYTYTGRSAESEALLREALAIQETEGDTASAASTLVNLGNLLAQLGRHEEAERALHRADEDFARAGVALHRNLMRSSLAIIYQQTGRHALAVEEYSHAAAGAAQAGDRLNEARLRANLGLALHDLGRVDESEKEITTALDFAREAGDRSTEALALQHLANVYLHRLDPRTAETCRHAMDLYATLGDVRMNATTRGLLAEWLYANGDLADAREHAERALHDLLSVGDPIWSALQRAMLGRLALLEGEAASALIQAREATESLLHHNATDFAAGHSMAVEFRALVALGRTDEAEALLGRMAGIPASADVASNVQACRNVLAAARAGGRMHHGYLVDELAPVLRRALGIER